MMPTMHIAITNEASVAPFDGWQESELAAFAEFLLMQLRIPAESELSIAFIDPEPMAQLHEQWLQLPGPTDVMSFPMDELREGGAQPGHLGDVVICPQVAADQSVAAGHSPRAEVELLLAHGVLHLLGHDHAEPEEHAVMFTKQADLLAAWQAAQHTGAGVRAGDESASAAQPALAFAHTSPMMDTSVARVEPTDDQAARNSQQRAHPEQARS